MPKDTGVMDTLFPAPADEPEPEAVKSGRGYKCGTCGDKLDVYEGENEHKLGTGFCSTCGDRMLLPA